MKQYFVYIPGDDAEQGPFPAAMIQNAYEQGIYSDTVMLRDIDSKERLSINTVFAKAQPTFPNKEESEPFTDSPPEDKDTTPEGNGENKGCLHYFGMFFSFAVAKYYYENDLGDNTMMDIAFPIIFFIWLYCSVRYQENN